MVVKLKLSLTLSAVWKCAIALSGTSFGVCMTFLDITRQYLQVQYTEMLHLRGSTPVVGTELRTFSECACDIREKLHLLVNLLTKRFAASGLLLEVNHVFNMVLTPLCGRNRDQ